MPNQPPLNPGTLAEHQFRPDFDRCTCGQKIPTTLHSKYHVDFPDYQAMARHQMEALAAALPEVTSDAYTVAIRNTEKSTGRVFFDYPGCTPEIGTLDDARELLSWVSEGIRESSDSPYEIEARIYKLAEVEDV